MLTDEHVKKLYRLFCRKLEEVYEKNACPDPFGGKRIVEFNASQNFLSSSLSLEVIDIQAGKKPGIEWQRGKPFAVRIPNPSNKTGLGREFIVVPLEFAERSLVLDWIPDKWPLPEG
jgi:hypothetical protein